MTFVTSLDFYDIVYLKTDPDQLARMVTNVELFPGGNGEPMAIYAVSMGAQTSRHYEGELSREKDEVKIIAS